MKPRIWVGIIAGFIGLAFTLFICFFGGIIFDTLVDGTQGLDRAFDVFFWEFVAIGLVFLIGCITFGYFAAKQEGVATKSDGAKAGAWTGFIVGFLTILPPIFYINYYLIDSFLYIDGGLPSMTERLLRTGGRSIWMSLIPAIMGSLLGMIGSLMVIPSPSLEESVDTSSN